jgi:hypothetical protein
MTARAVRRRDRESKLRTRLKPLYIYPAERLVVNKHSYIVVLALLGHWYHKPKSIFATNLTKQVLRLLTVLSVLISLA